MADPFSPDHNPEGCPGCRPVVFDPDTGEINADMTRKAEAIFDAATPDQKRSWHRVTCLNSRDPIEVNLAGKIVEALQRGASN